MKVLAAIAALLVSASAFATLPLGHKWILTDSTGNPNLCRRDANNQCRLYDSADEACKDLPTFGPVWNMAASGLEQGTPPNAGFQTCLGNLPVSGCSSPILGTCNTGSSASQQPNLPFCPINGSQSGSACICAD